MGWRDYNPAGWSGVEHHALRPNLPTMGGFSPLRTSSNREQQIVTAVHPFPDPLQTHPLNPDLRLSHYQHFEWHFYSQRSTYKPHFFIPLIVQIIDVINWLIVGMKMSENILIAHRKQHLKIN